MTDKTLNDTQAAIDAGMKIGALQVLTIRGVDHVVVPSDMNLESFEQLMPRPIRIQQIVDTLTAESFTDYFNRFADTASVIFCDLDRARFVGVIDYPAAQDQPAWGEHKVRHTCKETEEWKTWQEKNGKGMSQLEFAFFIEQNADEIREPEGATMLEIATTLKTSTKVAFESGQRLSDGQVQFKYHEELDGKAGASGQVQIPETFKLGMRVFEGGEAFELEARFRYRIKEGGLTMWYDLVRPHKVHRAAVDSVYEQIKANAIVGMMLHGSL